MVGLRLALSLSISGRAEAAFATIREAVVSDSADVSLLVIGDSTGNDSTEWVRQFATWLGTEYSTHTVNHRAWNDGSNVYDAATVISTGSGSHSITIYNACIAGTRPHYLMGSKFSAAIGGLAPDVIIWNHGQNVYGPTLTDAHYQGEFFAAFDQVRAAHPAVPTAIILQNPRRDDDNMAAVVSSLRTVARFYGAILDVYSEFVAQGKSASLYLDNIHPSQSGSTVYRDKVIEAWEASGSPLVVPSQTSRAGTNILTNGDFSDWTGAVPAGWLSSVGATATKEMTIVDDGDAYSMKVTGTSAGAGITQDVSTTAYAGKTVFLAVRQYVPSGQASTVGRIYFRYTAGGNTITTTRSSTYGTDGWCWQMLGPITLPSNTTAVRVFLYCDSADNVASTVYYGRAVLVEASAPRNMN